MTFLLFLLALIVFLLVELRQRRRFLARRDVPTLLRVLFHKDMPPCVWPASRGEDRLFLDWPRDASGHWPDGIKERISAACREAERMGLVRREYYSLVIGGDWFVGALL